MMMNHQRELCCLPAADLKRDTDNCISKVKADMLGTYYTMWSRGELAGERNTNTHLAFVISVLFL
jgi:hypothetical protein